MINPVVLIATHLRKKVTSQTIEHLQNQSVQPYIVLVVSLYDEYLFFSEKFDGITVMIHENQPLGKKWGFGARYAAKYFKADPLIILGSDDILGRDFIKNTIQIMQDRELDFMGINEWFVMNEKTRLLHRMKYRNTGFPLGGARAYSQRLLEKVNYTVFDVKRDRLLDDYGWGQAKESGLKYELIQDAHAQGLNIISIKGDWITMNSAEAILKAKSCIELESFKNGQQKLEELL